jgi:type VI secretion system secreted protein VgrG
MTWNMQTRSMTFSGPRLPQIVGVMRTGEKISEPMLTVRSVRGREAVGELFEYVILAAVENPDFLQNPADAAQIDLEEIIGTRGTVAIQITGIGTYKAGQQGATARVNVGADTRYISGNIASAEIHCMEDRAAVYRFVLRPFVWRATLNRDSRILSGSVIDVLHEVFGKYVGTVDWRIAGPGGGKGYYPPRDMIRQAWESDWTFAHRLMEEWGLVYWFEHRDGFHSLVVSDTLGGYHRHGAAYETLRYHTGSRIDEEHIGELSVSYSVTPDTVTVNDHDYMGPRLRNSLVPLREEYTGVNRPAGRNIEIYATAEFAQPLARKTFSDANDAREEGRHLARVKLEAERCKALRAKGRGNLRGLQPGRTFGLTDYPQDKANREYIVLACDLEIAEVATSSGAWRTYTVNTAFELQPSSVHYRLAQVTPRPSIDGLEFAVIVAPQDNELWIDNHNRLLVQFDWDRQARFDGATSIWVRVISQWQGGEMGVVTPGRAGQMVMVSHVHGDPDRPIVSGFVVDKFNPPPWALPDNMALSGMRSRSLDHGFTSNHLALDDTPGKQQAQLASDHGKSSLTVGYNTRIDGNKGRQDARGEGFELRTDLWGVVRAARGLLISSHGRESAAGNAKDMDETVARLTQARDLHETLTGFAQQHEAQQESKDQSDVTRNIKQQNEELRGTPSTSPSKFREFTAPHLTLASPAGIETTTAGSTHIQSDQDLALTTGRHVAIAAGKSLYASVLESVALFVRNAGMKLIAAAGKIHIEAQTDSVEVIARKALELISASDWINLKANQGVRINGGGSILEISADGIVGYTSGKYLIHAADHATADPKPGVGLTAPVLVPDSCVCPKCLHLAADLGMATLTRT